MINRLRDARSHVVVGTDFSQSAADALEVAQQISRHFRAPLTVVHAVPVWTDKSWESDTTAVAWLRSARLRGDRILTRPGSPWTALARTAVELSAALIVIGSHGRSGYQPLELGSTAARLNLIATCPVLIVSPPRRSEKIYGLSGNDTHDLHEQERT